MQKLYADFRSRGHRVELVQSSSSVKKENIIEKVNNYNKPMENIDCFDVINRQQIAVLFYSKCESSPVYPHICIKPRVIEMEFYGDNDMTLGKNKNLALMEYSI